MASDTSLVFNLIAKDKVSGTVGNIESKFKKLGTVVAGLGLAAVAGLGKLGMEFDDAYNTIRTGSGATGEALEGLKDDMKAVMMVTPQPIDKVSAAIADLNTLTGLSGKPLQELTQQFLNLEKVSGEDLDASTVTRVFGDWSIATDKQSDSMDYLWKVSQSTGIGVGELSEKVVKFGSPMRSMGFSFEQTAALLGKFNKEGVNGDLVMSSMRIGLGKLAKAGEDPQAALKRLTEDIKGAGSRGEATAMAMELFGAKAGPDMAAAIMEGRFEVDELMNTLGDSKETINGAAGETMTFSDKLQILKNQGMVALEPIATAIVDLLKDFMDKLKPIGEWMKDNPEKVKTFALILGGLATAIGVLVLGLWAYNTVMTAVTAAQKLWTAAQWLFNTAMLANPITWIVLLIVGLVAAIVLIATKTDWFQRAWSAAWGFIKTAVNAVWTFIRDNIFKPLGTFFTQTIPNAAKTVKDKIVGAWNAVKSGLSAAWTWLKDNVLNPIKNFFTQTIPNAAKTVKDKVVSAFTTVKNKVRELISNAIQYVKDKFNSVVSFVRGLPGKISNAASGLFNGIKNAFKSAINWIIGKWNGLSFTLPSISVFGKKIGGATLSTPNIPMLAKGGTAAMGGAAVVGDAGPEILDLPKGARVTPLSRSGGNGGGGGTFKLVIEKSGDPLIDALFDALRDKIRIEGGGDVQTALGR